MRRLRHRGGVERGADRGFVIGRPFRAVTVRHLALDHGGSQRPFAGVVGRLDLSGEGAEGQQLVARPGDFRNQFRRNRAGRLRIQDIVDLSLEVAPLGGQRRRRDVGDLAGKSEDPVEP